MRKLSCLSLWLLVVTLTGCAGQTATQRPVEAPPPETERAAQYPSVPLTAEVLYDLLIGEIAGQRGDLTTSIEALTRAAQRTRDPRIAERATLTALYAKRHNEALASARLWAELQPAQNEPKEALGEILLELEEPEAAQQQFVQILASARSPEQLGQYYLRLAAVLARAQQRARALEIMQELVRVHPERAEAHFGLAHLAVRQSDLNRAEQAIDQVLQLRPDWEDAAAFKARILVSRKDAQKARAFYESFLKRHPRATLLRLSYARYLVDLKQWDAARAQFKRVVELNPNDGDALYAVGLLALQVNQLDEAERYLKLNLNAQPENDQARLYLGQIAEQRRDYPQAIRWYNDIESSAYYFEAQTRIATAFAKQGDLAAARSHLHNIVPQNDQQRVQLVLTEDQLLREQKQFGESLKILNGALTALPDDADLLYARALVAEKLGMLELHERDLRQLIQKDPKNAHALNALGYTLADRTNRYQEALELIERAISLQPEDPFIMDSLGWVHYRMGNNAEAIKHLQRALNIRNDAEISAHLGEVLWVTGDQTAAESVWRQALQITPDNEVLLTIIKKFKP